MIVTVRAILVNKNTNQVLLIKHLNEHNALIPAVCSDFWTLPGGIVLNGESYDETLQRVIFGETGIEHILYKNCVMSRVTCSVAANGENGCHYERYYLAETDEMEILSALESEPKEYQWVSFDEMTGEVIFPVSFVSHLESLLKNPVNPIDITDADEILRFG